MTRSDADCNVGYYGVALERHLNEAPAIERPLLLHIAGRDALCTEDARAEIIKTLSGNTNVEIALYPDAGHAFAHLPGPSYRPDDATRADRRSLDFLAHHLAPSK